MTKMTPASRATSATAHTGSPIWPGPECLEHPAHRLGGRIYEAVTAGEDAAAAMVRIVGAHQRSTAEVEPRTRGIGEGRAKARARMERFVAWLRDDAGQRFAAMPSQVARYMSPEHYIRAALSDRWFWPLIMMGGQWCNRYAAKRSAADALLASPEWASLPWQRDPSEVSHA